MLTGKELREMRDEKGWSQEYLSSLVGSTGRTVSLHENKKVVPNKAAKKYLNVFQKFTIGSVSEETQNYTKETSTLSEHTDLEIVEYIAENIERFQGLSTFRKVIGLDEVVELRNEVKELRSLVLNKLKNIP